MRITCCNINVLMLKMKTLCLKAESEKLFRFKSGLSEHVSKSHLQGARFCKLKAHDSVISLLKGP